MAYSAANKAAHNVARALVRRQNAVGGEESYRADMVGDNADGNVLLVVLAVGAARYPANVVADSLYGINVEYRVNALHHSSKTLKTHTCIYILLREGGVCAVLVALELGEYQIPEFHISVAVAAYCTAGLAAAVLFAAVEIYLGTWAAGAVSTGFPEVIFFAHAEDMVHRHADLFMPYLFSLVVVLVNGNVKALGRQL